MTEQGHRLVAYHGKQALKEALVAMAVVHREHDRVVQGRYWDRRGGEKEPRGCAVGCTLESIRHLEGLTEIQHDGHDLYERYLGIPTGLAQLEDIIFENLSKDDALTWPERFLEAIPVGADLDAVAPHFFLDLLGNPDGAVQRSLQDPRFADQLAAVNNVVALITRSLAGDEPTADEWSAAESAAWSAASASAALAAASALAAESALAALAAESAAESAAWSAAALAAESALSAAWSAAAWSALAAAESAEFTRMSIVLLELLRAAPVPVAA